MKFKLDENLGEGTKKLFVHAGHEVSSVRDQNLQGISDRALFETCNIERRCLVTLDLDFSDVTRFPPQETGGIVVIRLPRNPAMSILELLVTQFLQRLGAEMDVTGSLWVIEVDRIRIHQSE